MRRFAIVTMLSLAACAPDRAKTVAQCQLETAKVFPGQSLDTDYHTLAAERGESDLARDFMIACMHTKNFRLTVEAPCAGIPGRETNPECYAPAPTTR